MKRFLKSLRKYKIYVSTNINTIEEIRNYYVKLDNNFY